MKPPLLFIHGAFTRAGRWRPWLDYFRSAGFTCLAPSLPAHDPPDRARLSRLTFEDYVEAMIAAAASLGERPVIVGSSMGGLVAQHVAARSKPAGLVLISSAPPWKGGGRVAALPYAFSYLFPVLLGRPLRGNKNAARRLVLHDLTADERDELLAIFADESGKAYRTMILGGPPMERGSVTCPVLCISGGGDRLFQARVAADIAAFYGARHVVYPHAGHTLASRALIGPIGQDIVGWIEGLAAIAPSPAPLPPLPVALPSLAEGAIV
ncbi:MAG TPA: alpha/beta fold hydrolase [Bauldia sp.]|nr:alpha/beta fold hydrolase [Bauldia sp.]